jgi:aspartate carbamoyltransferase regulatory subunit
MFLKILNFEISTTENIREILNCITNNCIGRTGVTWQGTNYQLPEDDTIVSKHVGVW